MAVKKRMTLKWLFTAPCLTTSTHNQKFMEDAQRTTPKKSLSETLNSIHRISLSDLSDPNSPQLTIADLSSSIIGSNLYNFSLSELKIITRNYSVSNLVGEGGFGPVYKGFVDDKLRQGLKAQPVAVKVLDLEGGQGHREWLAEVVFLGQLRHPHVVKLIGYCCEEEQRILVYEYMARGNLANHLFRKYSVSMPWSTRMKIAVETAKGLAFLHEEEKPVIYRDFKTSNILLDSDFKAKLSDFGLAKDGPTGDETHVSTRVMGTNGYAAPEYVKTGHLTMMSDVYSFGVVLLELLTGRQSIDTKRPRREQCLVNWVKNHPRKLDKILDPRLEEKYSNEGARRAIRLTLQCLNVQPKCRPTMGEVVETLTTVMELRCDEIIEKPFVYYATPPENSEKEQNKKGRQRVLRSRVVYSDTTLNKYPLNDVNPTKKKSSRFKVVESRADFLTIKNKCKN